MKMEEHFKETLNRAVANEPPALDAWDRFEQRAVRSRRVRLFAAIAAATAVAVASVIVVPKLGSDGGIGLSTEPPTTSPTPTPTADQYPGWSTHQDENGFAFRYPADWHVYTYEANPEVVAPGQRPGAGSGDVTMSVSFALLTEDFDTPEIRQQGFDRSTREDGRPFVWTERIVDGRTFVDYRFDWSSCLPSATGAPTSCPESGTPTLVVTIQIGTPALGEEHRETAERIVASLEYTGHA